MARVQAKRDAVGPRGPSFRWFLLPLIAYASSRGLWAPDEPRYAQIAQELVERGDFLVMHRCGELYPDKPPLLFWLSALLGAISQWNPAVMRLVSLASMAALAWFTAAFARRWWTASEARWAPVLLLGMALVAEIGGRLQIDPLLAACCCGALYFLTLEQESSRARARAVLLGGACAGAAALAKGPVAFANIGLPMLAWKLAGLSSRGPKAARKTIAASLALAILPVLVWAASASLIEPRLWRPLFFGQHLGRAVEGTAHPGPPWQNLLRMPAQLLPWTPLVVAGLVLAWKHLRAKAAVERDFGLVRAGLWFGCLFVFFSIIPAKRDLYLLPAYPAAALAAARAMSMLWFNRPGVRWPALWHAGLSIVLGLALAVARFLPAQAAFDPAILGWRPMVVALPFLAGGIGLLATATKLLPQQAAFNAATSWCAGLFLGALLLPPVIDGMKSPRELALYLAARPEKPAQIPCFGVQPEGYRFYGRIPAVQGPKGTGGQALVDALERESQAFLALASEDFFLRLPVEIRARLLVLHHQVVGSREILVLGRAGDS